jgi:hypothetical protein
MILFSVIFFAIGAAVLQEYVSGTRVRERGIELVSTTFRWSRVSVRAWHPRQDGFDLYLSVRPFRPITRQHRDRKSEFVIPVPASEWPALESFLVANWNRRNLS